MDVAPLRKPPPGRRGEAGLRMATLGGGLVKGFVGDGEEAEEWVERLWAAVRQSVTWRRILGGAKAGLGAASFPVAFEARLAVAVVEGEGRA